tara:strand:+ start:516 stop:1466 length:951 start_codon:yes stop_codon:yes gene_type:complete
MQYLLDTNVFRNLVLNKNFSELKREIYYLKSSEKNKYLKFLFSNTVCIELINHLSCNDSSKNECFKALNYKTRLCGDFVNDRMKGVTVPEFNELLSFYFFGKSSTHFIFNKNLLSLSYKISRFHDQKSLLNFQKEIDDVVQYKKAELDNLLKNIENHYLTNFSKTKDWTVFKGNECLKKEFHVMIKKKEFHKLFSLALIKMTFEKEIKNEYQLTQDQFLQFNYDFCLSIDFFIEKIWRKFIDIEKMEYFSNPKSDPDKRWNSFYDTQIIMACEFENCKGRKTKLVTTEKKILNHFKKHKKEDWCMSYQDFTKRIIN